MTNLQSYLLCIQLILTIFLAYQLVRYRKKFIFFAVIILLVLNFRIFSEIKNFYFFKHSYPSSQASKAPPLNLYFAKLNSLSSLSNLKQQISDTKANVLIIKNYNPSITGNLISALRTSAEMKILEYHKADFDLLLLTEFKWEIIQDNFDQQQSLPSYFVARIELNQETKTKLLFLNALDPLIEDNFHTNKAYCRRLATLVKNNQEPHIVVGSFLATPHSQCYNWFTTKERAYDSLWGKGLVQTWKADSYLINLKLDHIFYNKFWNLNSASTLPSIDRFHFPQSASFTFDHNFSKSALANSDKS